MLYQLSYARVAPAYTANPLGDGQGDGSAK